MLLALLLVVLGSVYFYWLYRRYHSVWKHIAKIPGPTAYPLFGNVLQIGSKPEDYFTTVRRWMKKYNSDCFRIYAGSQPYVFMQSPKNIEALLSSTALLFKSDFYDFMRPWLGEGLLTGNGQRWQKHRKMITTSFHFQILQDFLLIMNETTDRFMTLLGTFAEQVEMFDFQEIVTRSTIDVICESAMGTRVDAIAGKPSVMVNAMNDICYAIQERIFSALKRYDFYFRLTKEYRMQEKAIYTMRSEFSKIIERRRAMLQYHNDNNAKGANDGKRPKMAFLDNLLTAQVDGRSLTFQEIFEEVSTFMFEGHDTTASAITFAIFCISRHPIIQQRAYDEQLEIFGASTERSPSFKELQEMKYLELVIKESLRLFPSVPVIGRTLLESTEIAGQFIPKDTSVIIPIIGVAVDERNFPDPYTFRPERFEPHKRTNANPFDYVPFSAGPRNCIGQKFAMMELKVTISKMLRHFHILPAVDGLSMGIWDPSDPKIKERSPYDPCLAVLLTLKSMNGVYVRLKRRTI